MGRDKSRARSHFAQHRIHSDAEERIESLRHQLVEVSNYFHSAYFSSQLKIINDKSVFFLSNLQTEVRAEEAEKRVVIAEEKLARYHLQGAQKPVSILM